MTTNISKANPSKFQLIFPKLPEEAGVSANKQLNLNLVDGILPSITLTAAEIPYRGTLVYTEIGGLEYGDWQTKMLIDRDFNNWILIYDWIYSINNANDVLGRPNQAYATDASLHILDNFNNKILDMRFENVWPHMLSEVQFSYQESETILTCGVTFKYDRFERNTDSF